MSITPIALVNSSIVTGGTPVVAVDVNPNGGFITNPAGATESLFVDPTGNTSTLQALQATGTTFEIRPGTTWTVIPGQTTQTFMNAASSSHQVSGVSY